MKHSFRLFAIAFSGFMLISLASCSNSGSNTEETTNTEDITAADQTGQMADTPPVSPDTAKAAARNEKRDTVIIKTSEGDITVVLYNETPLHRENFLSLARSNYYNNIIFHRVIKGFMIQTGDPDSRNAKPGVMYGQGGPGRTIPAEIRPELRHKRGTLAAARLGDEINPARESSGSQFYICHVETPMLDGNYTIFGETIAGMDVVDKIATTPTAPGDRPLKDIKIISTTVKGDKADKAGKKGKKDAGTKSK